MGQTLGAFLWGSSSSSTYRLAYILTCSAVWPFIHMQADYHITKNLFGDVIIRVKIFIKLTDIVCTGDRGCLACPFCLSSSFLCNIRLYDLNSSHRINSGRNQNSASFDFPSTAFYMCLDNCASLPLRWRWEVSEGIFLHFINFIFYILIWLPLHCTIVVVSSNVSLMHFIRLVYDQHVHTQSYIATS